MHDRKLTEDQGRIIGYAEETRTPIDWDAVSEYITKNRDVLLERFRKNSERYIFGTGSEPPNGYGRWMYDPSPQAFKGERSVFLKEFPEELYCGPAGIPPRIDYGTPSEVEAGLATACWVTGCCGIGPIFKGFTNHCVKCGRPVDYRNVDTSVIPQP